MPVFASASVMLRRIFGRPPPLRRDPVFKFLERQTPLDEFQIVLDVGAHLGNTTNQYLHHFPNARVWSFEPTPATCDRLRARFASEPRVEVRQEALGSSRSIAPMMAAGTSVMNRIVDHEDPDGRYERVSVRTGDDFLAEAGLPEVDFLKIDTEGHDLQVLIGFTAALRRKAIRFLQVEAGMNATNRRHVPIQHFMQFLEPLGYHLYRVLGQMQEWNGPGILRRADLVFWRGT
jgi:FkbM family methyltransferase